jgi:hypothetical protein
MIIVYLNVMVLVASDPVETTRMPSEAAMSNVYVPTTALAGISARRILEVAFVGERKEAFEVEAL